MAGMCSIKDLRMKRKPFSRAGEIALPAAAYNFAQVGERVESLNSTDHEGTTELITDSHGTIVWQAGYEAFGKMVSRNGSIDASGLYTGEEHDDYSGMYYFNARWYDLNIGRFITEDPARSGNNWYDYASNDPLSKIDNNGLDDVGAVAAALGSPSSTANMPSVPSPIQYGFDFISEVSKTATKSIDTIYRKGIGTIGLATSMQLKAWTASSEDSPGLALEAASLHAEGTAVRDLGLVLKKVAGVSSKLAGPVGVGISVFDMARAASSQGVQGGINAAIDNTFGYIGAGTVGTLGSALGPMGTGAGSVAGDVVFSAASRFAIRPAANEWANQYVQSRSEAESKVGTIGAALIGNPLVLQ